MADDVRLAADTCRQRGHVETVELGQMPPRRHMATVGGELLPDTLEYVRRTAPRLPSICAKAAPPD